METYYTYIKTVFCFMRYNFTLKFQRVSYHYEYNIPYVDYSGREI
jgi:hypothetical protein